MLVKDESLRIKDIVKQTGYDKGHVSRLRKASRIDKLIADAVDAEREACAKVCEQIANELSAWPVAYEGLTAETKFVQKIGETIGQPFIEAIRARGQL
jgi:hypothetical protein